MSFKIDKLNDLNPSGPIEFDLSNNINLITNDDNIIDIEISIIVFLDKYSKILNLFRLNLSTIPLIRVGFNIK